MSDLIVRDEDRVEGQALRPPLCLRRYFDEQEGRSAQMPVKKPPGVCRARVIERRGNLIVLEFAAPDAPEPKPRRRAGMSSSTAELIAAYSPPMPAPVSARKKA